MKKLIIPVDKDLNSTLKLDLVFPFFLSHDDLNDYIEGFVNWHKQSSVEIAVILEGSLKLRVLEHEEIMSVGDAFIIMPDQLHTVQPIKNQSVAKYYTIFFEPIFLYGFKGSFFEREYYLPSLYKTETFFRFNINDNWAIPIFNELKSIYDTFPIYNGIKSTYDTFSNDTPEYQLSIQRKIQDIWINLWNNLISQKYEGASKLHNTRILEMIEYLHNNYSSKFSLSNMAINSNISRGECCRFFKKVMHMTISEYLIEHRLSKAVHFLETTDLTITEISETVGFSSTSYFIQSFKKKTNYSPLSYRKIYRKEQ